MARPRAVSQKRFSVQCTISVPNTPPILGFSLVPSGRGCHAVTTQKARTRRASGSSARCSAATVARPTGVWPMIRSPSADQRKCSVPDLQSRIEQRGSRRRVSGSLATVRSALYRLHSGLAQPEVGFLVGPPLRPGEDMFDLKASHHQVLWAQAVAATVSAWLSHPTVDFDG